MASSSGSGELPDQGTNVVRVCLNPSTGQWGVWVRDPVPGARRNFLGFFTQEEMEVNDIHMPDEESPVNMLQNSCSASSKKQVELEVNVPSMLIEETPPNTLPNSSPTPPGTPANNPESISDDEDVESRRVRWDRVLGYVEVSRDRSGDEMEARIAERNGQGRRNLSPVGLECLEGLSDDEMEEPEEPAQNPNLGRLNALADFAQVHSELGSEMGDPEDR